ncbi:MAG: putative peptidoglycan glycosyltransferase FtsW [bacterium]|nr:putative peptidoglycan glycosyltransferase FtsW [bacterium]
MRKTDTNIGLITLILIGIGIIMVYSSSAFSALRLMDTSTFFLKKQLIPLGIGAILCIVVSKIDYHWWGKYSYLILGLTLLLLLFVLLFGPSIHGTRRWLRFKWFSIQPSELAKLGVIIFTANFISTNDISDLKKGIIPLLSVLGIVFLLIGLEPSFGMLAVLCITCFVLLFLGGAKVLHLLILLLIIIGMGFAFLTQFAYARLRFLNFFSHDSYQLRQSIYGVGAGGLFGVGLGNSRAKLLFLPEPYTDFIFSIIGEELGFIGASLVSVLFLLLLIRGIKVGNHAPDRLGFLLATGFSFAIFISAIFHIGVTCGIFPTTGLPLPFISFGGSNLLVNLIGIGILLNISRIGNLKLKTQMLRLQLKNQNF